MAKSSILCVPIVEKLLQTVHLFSFTLGIHVNLYQLMSHQKKKEVQITCISGYLKYFFIYLNCCCTITLGLGPDCKMNGNWSVQEWLRWYSLSYFHYGNEWHPIMVMNFHNTFCISHYGSIVEIYYHNTMSFVTVMNIMVRNTTVITPAHSNFHSFYIMCDITLDSIWLFTFLSIHV